MINLNETTNIQNHIFGGLEINPIQEQINMNNPQLTETTEANTQALINNAILNDNINQAAGINYPVNQAVPQIQLGVIVFFSLVVHWGMFMFF